MASNSSTQRSTSVWATSTRSNSSTRVSASSTKVRASRSSRAIPSSSEVEDQPICEQRMMGMIALASEPTFDDFHGVAELRAPGATLRDRHVPVPRSDAAFYRPFRDGEMGGNLPERQAAEVRQHDWGPLRLRQGGEQQPGLLGLQDRLHLLFGARQTVDASSGQPVMTALFGRFPANPVDRATMGHAGQPRPESAEIRLESLRVVPEGSHDDLGDVLGGKAVSGDRQGGGEDTTTKTFVGITERSGIPSEKLGLELPVRHGCPTEHAGRGHDATIRTVTGQQLSFPRAIARTPVLNR